MSRTHLVPDSGPVLSLSEALYCACRDAHGGITAVALEMQARGLDVSPDKLQKALNPNDQRPLRACWLEAIVDITRDPRLLAALVRPAEALAFRPRPVRSISDGLRALGDLLADKAMFVRALHDGLADGVLEPAEVGAIRYHADQLMGQLLGIVAGAEMQEVQHVA